MAANANLGNVLGDDVGVFRAFAAKGFRDRKKNKVRYFAYLLRAEDVDGLSVGLSPRGAVKHLNENHGYCELSVRAAHALPHNLQIRLDLTDGDHAFVCNLPLMTISDEQRELAVLIAGELARLSQVVTCDPYKPNGCDNPSPD